MIAPVSGAGYPAGASTAGRRHGKRRVDPASASARGSRNSADAEAASEAPETAARTARAVVLREPAARREQAGPRMGPVYGDAAFITQLIATYEGMPQTRARRRAEPDVSTAAYAAAARSTIHFPTGSILKRSA
ncbi:hypothetical protein [Breoghania sp. L-A4]|uniref:hypothetical protein n=1 Tax=Breoghania sp. L-A4 TaxID=2304600 RepID=UPI000E35FFED|nr:hypothetical protein [Breoghania sp. L-A4]AXS38857.1 hypothetical protein D1F64_00755 [Breoghania sp. L-A4]